MQKASFWHLSWLCSRAPASINCNKHIYMIHDDIPPSLCRVSEFPSTAAHLPPTSRPRASTCRPACHLPPRLPSASRLPAIFPPPAAAMIWGTWLPCLPCLSCPSRPPCLCSEDVGAKLLVQMQNHGAERKMVHIPRNQALQLPSALVSLLAVVLQMYTADITQAAQEATQVRR